MKKTNINFIRIIALFIILTIPFSAYSADKNKVYLKAEYSNVIGEHKVIIVNLRTKIDNKFVDLEGMPIDILMATEEGESLLTSIITDNLGNATLLIEQGYPMVTDDKGTFNLIAKFNGNEEYKAANKKLKAKDLIIKADFSTDATTKNIDISIVEIGANDEKVIPESIDVEVFVERMFTNVSVVETEILNGNGIITIPDGLQGDKNGNLKLKILVSERKYGDVILLKTINWGIPLEIDEQADRNFTGASYIIFMIVSVLLVVLISILLDRRLKKTN